jgi:phospholipase C
MTASNGRDSLPADRTLRRANPKHREANRDPANRRSSETIRSRSANSDAGRTPSAAADCTSDSNRTKASFAKALTVGGRRRWRITAVTAARIAVSPNCGSVFATRTGSFTRSVCWKGVPDGWHSEQVGPHYVSKPIGAHHGGPFVKLFYGRFAALAACLALLAACSGADRSSLTPAMRSSARSAASSTPIQHVVIIVQENRSLDNLFATFPGADGATSGYYLKKVGSGYQKTAVTLKKVPLNGGLDINHASQAYNDACDGENTYPKTSCDMDGFNLEGINGNNPAGTYPYQYIDPKDIKPYWNLAKRFALGDHLFQTQGSGSFTAHQDLIAGGSTIDDTNCGSSEPSCALIDYTQPKKFVNWGCGAPVGTTTTLLTQQGDYLPGAGPFPCLTYPTPTMRDLMDAASVTWKYYTPPYKSNTTGALWNAFAAISAVYNGPEWTTNVSIPECNVFADIAGGALPQVSWVIPEQQNSDHPTGKKSIDNGPQWVGAVVNAIGKSVYWKSTAVIILWDDWGGFYDHEPPPFFDNMGGLGFRVPLIVVSPYVPKNEISHTQYEFGSILKFVEETFDLGSMGTTDVRATSIANMFNLNQKPRRYSPVSAPPSSTFCTDAKSLEEPVDRE